MQKKHNLDFCPQCGNKLEGIEDFCPECGHKLASPQQQNTQPPKIQQTIPPPIQKEEKVVEPPKKEVVTQPPPPPVTQNTTKQQPVSNRQEAKSSGFPWMKVVIIAVVVIALGVGGFFVATKTNLLSGGSTSSSNEVQIATATKYFVCYSTASVNGKVKATVSNIMITAEAAQDIEWAKRLFEKSLKSKLGGEKKYFKKVFAKSYSSMDDATKGLKKMKEDYKKKGYQIKTIRVDY